jgi:hypothetical protein
MGGVVVTAGPRSREVIGDAPPWGGGAVTLGLNIVLSNLG